MKAVSVRGVSAEDRDGLANKAARSRQSMQEYLLGRLTEMTDKPSNEEVIARARERVATTGVGLTLDEINSAIHEDRQR